MLAKTPSVHVLQRPKAANDGRHWHIMTCMPNLERQAEEQLKMRRFECYLPKRVTKVSYGVRGGPYNRKRKRDVIRPIAPGYLFLRFCFERDKQRRDLLAQCNGIHNFLRIGGAYAILTQADIDRLFSIEYGIANNNLPANSNGILTVGDRVRVTEGPFADIDGMIESLDGEDGLSVLMALLGRQVPVKLFTDQVEKL